MNDDLREIPCEDCEIVIKRDGMWVHNGAPIGRMDLVRLWGMIFPTQPRIGILSSGIPNSL